MPGRYDDEDDSFSERLAKRSGARESRSGEGKSELGELIDMLGRRISGALLFAGVAIGLGVYAGGGGGTEVEAQKYHAFATDGEVFRLNTESGTLIACSASSPCRIVLQRGQELEEDQNNTLFKAPAAPQLPAPAAQAPAQAPQQSQPALPAPKQEPATPPAEQ